MPTFATAFYTATKEARLATGRLGASNISSGTVEYAVIPYVLAGTEAAADVINLCLLPAGVIPVPELSKMVCMSDPGTALTVKIGTAADDDGWAVSLAATVAGAVETLISGGTAPAWMVTPTPLVADTGSGNAIVKATVVTATAITATTVINFILAYKRGR